MSINTNIFPIFKWSPKIWSLFAFVLCSILSYAQETNQDIAIRHAQNGEFDKAMPFFLKEYDEAVAVNDTSRIVQAARLLGNGFSLLNDSLNGHKYFTVAEGYARDFGDEYVYFISLSGLTYYYVTYNQPQKALKYSRIAVGLIEDGENAEIASDTLNKGSAYINMGAAYGQLGNDKRALTSYLKAAGYHEQFETPVPELATLYCNIGNCYEDLNQKDEALKFFNSGLAIAVESNQLPFIRYALKELFNWHKAAGNTELALEYLEKYTVLKDTMLHESVIRSIEEMNTRYESERLKGEITELNTINRKHENRIQSISLWIGILIAILFIVGGVFVFFVYRQRLVARNRKLEFEKNQAELKQRILTAQMNPHFLFNSLNSIQRMYMEGSATEAMDFTANFGMLLRKVLQYSELELISLSDDLEVLQMYLNLEKRRSDTDFQFEIEIDEAIDPSFVRVPPMIVQPFVENAIWHGILPLKEKGMIRLTYTIQGDYLECRVEDNGVGFENTQHERKKGHISKGVRITRDRLANIPNAISIEQMGESGTLVIIKIPQEA